MNRLALFLAPLLLAGCAVLSPPPSGDTLSALPLVVYPATPPQGGDYVYKLPAGVPLDLRIRVDGDALATRAEQTLSAPLARDLYLYKRWASEDARRWVDARELIGVNLDLRLPSYETPGPGAMHLSVARKRSD